MRFGGPLSEGRDAVLIERALSGARLLAGVYGVWQLGFDPGAIDQPILGVLWAAVIVYGLVGLGLLWRLRGPYTDLGALPALTLVLDAAAIVTFAVLSAVDPADLTYIAVLSVPVLAALKFGLVGALAGTLVVVVEEAVRAVVRAGVDARPDGGEVTLVVFLAAVVSLITGWQAQVLARTRDSASRQTRVLARTTAEYEALLRVMRAGIEVGEMEVATRVLRELQGTLGDDVPIAAILSDPDTGRLETIRFADRAIEAGPALHELIDPDGPAARALETGRAQLPSSEEVASLRHGTDGARSEIVAPMRSHGRVLGVLVAESQEPDAFSAGDLEHLGRLADQVAIVLDAARSLQHETELGDRYRELDRMKTDFVAITSHELRTPLTAIIGFVETMQRTDVEIGREARLAMLDAVARQARRLSRLVDDLRTVSAIDAGTLEIRMERTHLDRVIDDVVESLGDEDLEVGGPAGLTVAADAYRLGQVLTNLVRNAREHGEPPILLRWDAVDGHVDIEVTDHGPGIPADRREDVFDRFVQLGDTDRHQRGSGLGLAISRDLVEAMGGTLELVSAETGAHFRIALPRVGD